MFCTHCGHPNAKGARYCGGCGQSMAQTGRKGWMITISIACLLVLGGVGYGFIQVLGEGDVKSVAHIEPAKEPESPIKEPIADNKDATPKSESAPKEKEKTQVIRETLPRVFTIFTEDGLGSGFLYAKGGLIVTNAHVVAGYTDVVVRNSDGKDAAGKVIGISDKYDVALIRSEAFRNLQPLHAESVETPIGTEVIALGSPTGLENTASIGYLTGVNRDIELGFIYEKAYQIDAQIDNGSSGGPLLDAKTGKVIGINSLIRTDNRRFGFSIPLYTVTPLIDSWVKNPMTERQVASLFGVYENYAVADSYDEDGYYDDYQDFYENEEDYVPESTGYFDPDHLEDFILEFRSTYETALLYEEFHYIEDFLLPGSSAYKEYRDYFNEIANQGMHFEFYENVVTDLTIQHDTALLSTYETFNFINAAGDERFYEKEKIYEVLLDEEGYYRIKQVKNK
ncbi:serine protease [Bacillus sp. OxB-1]|uniref:trypsin-like peptidase domain-containing protein n=1 Tax=Bacillus sp. (strain OxB-1) TaxID=98228 RepID=UPI0005821368|nr:trypsin-like peptidase domain-containing protein [Bacillus sp. OxB-1]BAQ10020.1 serine protease [Bacillus sp. OxB-1]